MTVEQLICFLQTITACEEVLVGYRDSDGDQVERQVVGFQVRYAPNGAPCSVVLEAE